MNAKLIGIGMLLLGSGMALAADDTLEQARRCASQSDSLQRLVCYDRLFGAGAPAASAVAPAAAPAVPRSAAAPPAAAPVVAAPAAAAPRAPQPASPPAAAPAQDFGADQLRRSSSEAGEEAPRTITAKVTALRETRTSVFRITLDNGQIWQQMDMDSLFHLENGDTVEINRGKLGGYRMSRQSRGGSGWVRVNRVK